MISKPRSIAYIFGQRKDYIARPDILDDNVLKLPLACKNNGSRGFRKSIETIVTKGLKGVDGASVSSLDNTAFASKSDK